MAPRSLEYQYVMGTRSFAVLLVSDVNVKKVLFFLVTVILFYLVPRLFYQLDLSVGYFRFCWLGFVWFELYFS